MTAYGFSLSLSPSLMLDAAPDEPLALVGVAIANNLGTDLSRAAEIPVELPADVMIVQDALMQDTLTSDNFLLDHFRAIDDYAELVNIDIIAHLASKTDRKQSLERYIEVLQTATEVSQASLDQLTSQAEMHESAVANMIEQRATAQADIEMAYDRRDADVILATLISLDEITATEQNHRHVAVFSRRMAREYQSLIASANAKMTLLRANIDSIAQGITVNLPTGTSLQSLKNLNIFSSQ